MCDTATAKPATSSAKLSRHGRPHHHTTIMSGRAAASLRGATHTAAGRPAASPPPACSHAPPSHHHVPSPFTPSSCPPTRHWSAPHHRNPGRARRTGAPRPAAASSSDDLPSTSSSTSTATTAANTSPLPSAPSPAPAAALHWRTRVSRRINLELALEECVQATLPPQPTASSSSGGGDDAAAAPQPDIAIVFCSTTYHQDYERLVAMLRQRVPSLRHVFGCTGACARSYKAPCCCCVWV